MLEPPIPSSSNYNNEINLKDLIVKIEEWVVYLKSKWKIIFLAGLLGGAVGFIYAYLQKPFYTATLTYALEDEKSGGAMSGALGLASSLGVDLGTSAGGAFGSANLMELMHSRSLIEKTLLSTVKINGKNTTLVEYYISINNLRKIWNEKPEMVKLNFPLNADRTTFSRVEDSILGSFSSAIDKGQLSISLKDKKVAIGSIEVKSEDELFAKFFCENLVKEVTDFYVETKSRKAKMNVAILEKQADSIRAELNAAITGVAIANDNTFNLNPGLNIKRTQSAKKQVDVQANTAILTQLVSNLELAKIALRKETPLIQIIDSPILPLQKTRVSKLKSILALGCIFGFFTIFFFIGKRVWRNINS